ncbi:MAG: YicC family protein [Phenylobacterium zucineum]|nr:MAG: YicC family protein [Phenylobacterium zucineum]
MSLSGMTGFGRSEGATGDWTWSVEARSVNGRNLDLKFRGPPGLDGLERQTREAVQSRFQRGQVTVGVTAKRSLSRTSVQVNLEQAEYYLKIGGPWITRGDVTAPSLDGLLGLRGVLDVESEVEPSDRLPELEAAILGSIHMALDGLNMTRREEGTSLEVVLSGQLSTIADLVAQAEGKAQDQPAVIQARFARRMAELVGEGPGVAEKIVVEAAAMAVKADVREELDRLHGHVKAARNQIQASGPSGRRLDFLTQEFMREANTLCSKSALPELTTLGLELKAVIEQFREQVQNVE